MSTQNNWTLQEFMQRFEAGMDKAYLKLVQKKAREGGYLVISQNGQVVKVKAEDVLKELNKTA